MFNFPITAFGGSTPGSAWTTWNASLDGSSTDSTVTCDNNRVHTVKLATDKCLSVWFNSNSLYAVVQTTSGTTVSYGTALDLSLGGNQNGGLGLCVLDSGRVFLCYRDGSNGNVIANVLSISGTTITKNTASGTLVTSAGGAVSCVLLDTDKILIAYKIGASTGQAVIVTTTGTTVNAAGTAFTFESSPIDSICDMPVATLSTTSVLVTYGIVPAVKGIVLSISGSTITAPTSAITINTTNLPASVGRIEVAALSATKAICTYNISAATALKGMPLTISGTTITAGTEASIQGTDINQSISNTGIIPISTTIAMTLFGLASDGTGQGNVITVGSSVTPATTRAITTGSVSVGSNGTIAGALLDSNRILASYFNSDQSRLYSKVLKAS